MKFKLLLFLSTVIYSIIPAQNTEIWIDEDFSDWQNVPVLSTDPTGDHNNGDVDFKNLWVTHDDNFLYIRMEVGNEINLQNDNSVTLYLDTDNNASTGTSAAGLGAEFTYDFGDRSGTLTLAGATNNIYHSDIFLISSPTVTSTEFELAISRNISFNGQTLFGANDFKIALVDQAASNYDQVPDTPGGITFSFLPDSQSSLPTFSISKKDEQHLRVLSYNVLRDNLFESSVEGNFRRIIQAINPVIIGFQEIYDNSSADVAAKMENFLPSGAGEQWYHGSVAPDVHAISRYPIIGAYPIAGTGNGAFLIDLGESINKKLLFIVAHPPCCSNNTGRQEEIDAMMGFIRDAKNGLINGLILPSNSPIIITGDMNLVGFKEQVETLLTGNIMNEAVYGPDFNPDWDSTALEDTKPYTTGLPMTFTWYREPSSFSPGRLDYIIYSGSVLNLENSFSLFTPALANDSLSFYGLQSDDVVIASDHLPLVADFSFGQQQSTSIDSELEQKIRLNVFPNPVHGEASLNYFLPKNSPVLINISTLDGKEIRSIDLGNQPSGEHTLALDLSDLTNGVYTVRLISDHAQISRKVFLLD